MARGADIEGFADKLKLALDQANLSRAALAQQVGVDKSVVARWLTGALRPGDQSLAALSAVLARHLPGFSQTMWGLPVAGLAQRLGIVTQSQTATVPQGEEAELGTIANFVTQYRKASAGDNLDLVEDRFAGLWVAFLFFGSSRRGIRAYTQAIWRGTDGLACRSGDGVVRSGRPGPVWAQGRMLNFVSIGPERNLSMASYILTGTIARVAIMDGLLLLPFNISGGDEGQAVYRTISLRLAPPERDRQLREARYRRMVAMVRQQNDNGWEEIIPPILRRTLEAPLLAAGQFSPESPNLAISESELARRSDDPGRLELRDAVTAIQAHFAPALEAE